MKSMSFRTLPCVVWVSEGSAPFWPSEPSKPDLCQGGRGRKDGLHATHWPGQATAGAHEPHLSTENLETT